MKNQTKRWVTVFVLIVPLALLQVYFNDIGDWPSHAFNGIMRAGFSYWIATLFFPRQKDDVE